MNRDNPVFKNTTLALLLLLGIYDFLALGGVFDYLSIYVSIVTHRGINLAFLISLAYLIKPAKKNLEKFYWYDFCLLLLGLIPALYVTFQPDRIFAVTEDPDLVTTTEIILFLGLVLSIMEAGRRSGGLGLLIATVFFFSAVFLGDYYPGPFYARTLSLQSVTAYMYLCLGASSLFGLVADLGSTILVAFMLFGGFLQISGAGEFFIKLGLAVAGKYRGGPAKVAIFASGLMGSISGSGVANVVTTGSFTIPLMKKVGFKPHFAGAVEAVSSNGGQVAPPVMGAVAFLIAQMLGISYWDVCKAAFIPAVLYYIALFFMIDFEAAKQGLRGIPKQDVPSLRETLKEGWHYFLPIGLLVFLIANRTFSVYRSCIFAIILLVILSFLGDKKKRFTFSKFAEGIQTGIRGMVLIAGPLYAAGIIIGSIQMTGIGINFTRLITQFAGQSIFLMLVLAALSSFVLGMGMSSVPCYIICALLVGPPMIAAGISPIAAHLFFFYWGILSFITPAGCGIGSRCLGDCGSQLLANRFCCDEAWNIKLYCSVLFHISARVVVGRTIFSSILELCNGSLRLLRVIHRHHRIFFKEIELVVANFTTWGRSVDGLPRMGKRHCRFVDFWVGDGVSAEAAEDGKRAPCCFKSVV